MKCSFACLGYTENLPARLGGKKVFIDLSSCSGVDEKIKHMLVKCGAQRTEFLNIQHVYAIIVDKRQPWEKKNFKFFISFKGCLYDKENNGEDDFWFIVNIPVHDYRAILTTNHYEKKKPEECSIKNFKVKS